MSQHSFNVYIDESGDDGMVGFRTQGGQGGASNWLVIGACVARTSRDLEFVKLRDQIKIECKPQSKKRDIHFKDFNHHQRRRACQILAGKPIRFLSVIGLKNCEEAQVFKEKNQLYFYLTRFLIERISWFCRDKRKDVPEGNGLAKITFSRRGGMSYDDFKSYLIKLRDEHDTEIHWPVIDIDSISAHDHSRSAALQVADCGVSAIASAFEPDQFGNVEDTYIKEIRGNIYHRNGNYFSYGLKALPKFENSNLTKDQMKVVELFR